MGWDKLVRGEEVGDFVVGEDRIGGCGGSWKGCEFER